MASKTETVAELPAVPLPFGMSKLLECMIRAVVVENPENVPRFLADYTSALLLYRNQNPAMELKEVIIQFQKRREVMKRSSETTSGDKVRAVKKKSGNSSFLTSHEAVLLSSEESLNSSDKTQSSATSLESVLEVEMLQETKLDKDTHLASGQTSKYGGKSEQMPFPRSSDKDIKTETKTVVQRESLSSSLSPSFLSSSSAAASYPSAKCQCPEASRAFRASTSLEDEENPQNMWTLYHLPHREEEGTLSTAILSQSQYQNGAKLQVIGPGYVLVTKCSSTGTQNYVKCICTHCSNVSTQGLEQDCLVIKPPTYQHNI